MMAEATHQSWSAQDLCQVNNAFAAVGIGNPDYDCDGVQDVFAGGDVDRDGIPDTLDNCPNSANPTQADWDSDGVGNSCDVDYDNDGIDNDVDTCPYDADPTNADSDGDGVGDIDELLDGTDPNGTGSEVEAPAYGCVGSTRPGGPLAGATLLAMLAGVLLRRRG